MDRATTFDINLSYEERQKFLLDLEEILCTLIAKNPDIYYVQGLHNIASVLLLTMEKQNAYWALESICIHYLKYLFYILTGILYFLLI